MSQKKNMTHQKMKKQHSLWGEYHIRLFILLPIILLLSIGGFLLHRDSPRVLGVTVSSPTFSSSCNNLLNCFVQVILPTSGPIAITPTTTVPQTGAPKPITFTIPHDSSTSQPASVGEGIMTDNNKSSPWPQWSHDVYWRQAWSTLEPTEGVYNFSSLDAALSQARAFGGKIGVRIMPYDGTLNYLPSYLKNLGNPPNWNSAQYMNAVHALLIALGNRYNTNPAFGWFEIGPYGCWGEWNFSCVPSGHAKIPMTDTNKQLLVTWALSSFPNKRLIMMLGGGTHSDGSSYDALTYALNSSSRMGMRADCLAGTIDNGSSILDYEYGLIPAIAKNRWMSAPVIFEYCMRNKNLSTPNFLRLAQQQIIKYHPVILGDGYGNTQASVQSLQDPALLQNFATAGFKYSLTSMTVSTPTIVPNTPFTVTTAWKNEGVTPTYDAWTVGIQLKNTTNTVVWEGKSSLNLQTFLPGTKSVKDTFTLPATILPGTYEFAIVVKDPTQYYPKMRLAILGWQTDGSYNIGRITISHAANYMP